MHILICNASIIPAHLYGGTERVIWDLGKELVARGHKVTFLVKKGSHCPFADVLFINPDKSTNSQIPPDVDVIHMNGHTTEVFDKPALVTYHGNINDPNLALNKNAVFVSKNHAERHGSTTFVHNGLDWNNYTKPNINQKRDYFHFLGKAAWRIKNLKGAIKISRLANEKLMVMGGQRLNLKMGFRFTPYLSVHFAGMVDNQRKSQLTQSSKGLIFPVLWHEPFGLALTESLYFGCPVIGTPYGSLPELITSDVGYLSNKSNDLAEAAKNIDQFSRKRCHEYARYEFNAGKMATSYLALYNKVLNNENLNDQAPQLNEGQNNKFLPFY